MKQKVISITHSSDKPDTLEILHEKLGFFINVKNALKKSYPGSVDVDIIQGEGNIYTRMKELEKGHITDAMKDYLSLVSIDKFNYIIDNESDYKSVEKAIEGTNLKLKRKFDAFLVGKHLQKIG